MQHRSLLLSLFFLLPFSCAASAEENGALLFEQKCSTCHTLYRPHADLMHTMVAPPITGVMKHVKDVKATKAEAASFIVDYLFDPSYSKAICQSQAIERFGLMPSQRGMLSREEAITIAEYLYDNFGSDRMDRKR